MTNFSHPSLTGTNVHEPYQYVQGSDPGSVGAGMNWLDTSSTPYFLKRRNSSNNGWIYVGATGSSGGSGDVVGPGSAIDGHLAVFSGSTGKLIADGGAPTGRTLIAQSTPTGTSGTVTFNSIPGTYTSLEIEIVVRTDKVAASSGMNLRFNNDTTDANYRRESLSQAGASVSGGVADNPDAFTAVAASGLANNAAYVTVKVPFYALTVFEKQAMIRTLSRTAAGTSGQNIQGVFWENTAAITRIDIITDDASNYVTGSTFRLYGCN